MVATAIARSQWIQLYKNLQRAALQFPQYNYRHFAKRRIRDYFVKYRDAKEAEQLQELYQDGLNSLEVIKRQAAISKMLPTRKLVIEGPPSTGGEP